MHTGGVPTLANPEDGSQTCAVANSDGKWTAPTGKRAVVARRPPSATPGSAAAHGQSAVRVGLRIAAVSLAGSRSAWNLESQIGISAGLLLLTGNLRPGPGPGPAPGLTSGGGGRTSLLPLRAKSGNGPPTAEATMAARFDPPDSTLRHARDMPLPCREPLRASGRLSPCPPALDGSDLNNDGYIPCPRRTAPSSALPFCRCDAVE